MWFFDAKNHIVVEILEPALHVVGPWPERAQTVGNPAEVEQAANPATEHL